MRNSSLTKKVLTSRALPVLVTLWGADDLVHLHPVHGVFWGVVGVAWYKGVSAMRGGNSVIGNKLQRRI